ncbi:hypothetical protein [Sulfitobacter sp. R18_1]|uniref:hypothetical protein n=1 Tax=Sulfitobacter sp. R18_1 TaxID=2821104 RepID=UPI001AD9E7B7|nr:hypothetical protein [Sulfitobacter sp. R18_1]MBO9428578.1 hypothetical protein [Sulfitobacter sp. R18_1]
MSKNTHTDPKYRFDADTGQLFFASGRTEIIVGDIDLAIAWTTDQDGNGCLHKHGSKENVEARAALIRSIDETVKTVVIPWEAISHPGAGPSIIEEVNHCLSISGRVSRIEEFLSYTSEEYDIEVFPRDTPHNPNSMKP